MKSAKTLWLSAVCIAIAALSISGAPAIQGISGDLSHGSTLTIHGSAFGSHADYNSNSPYLCVSFENLESGAMGTGWSGKAKIVGSNQRPNSRYSTQHYNNNYGHKHSVNSPTKKLYFSHWVRLHPNTTGIVKHNQFKSLNITYSGLTTKTYINIFGSDNGSHKWRTSTEDGQIYKNGGLASEVTPYGTWHRMSVWAVPKSAGNELQFMIDTKIIQDYGYLKDFTFTSAHSISYMSGNWEVRPPQMDDVYLNYTQARVELCDSPNYRQAAVRAEIQLPKEWSSSAIKIEVNTGAFQTGDKAYLFVIDGNGSLSQGFPVTVGATASGAFVNITTDSLPDTRIGQTYSQTLQATGGKTPYVWSIINGSLPEGLSLSATTGVISGAPTKTDLVTFTVQVTDASSPAAKGTREYTIWVKGTLGVGRQRSARTSGRMDQWTNGVFDVLGRRMIGGKARAMRTVVVRDLGGQIVKQIR